MVESKSFGVVSALGEVTQLVFRRMLGFAGLTMLFFAILIPVLLVLAAILFPVMTALGPDIATLDQGGLENLYDPLSPLSLFLMALNLVLLICFGGFFGAMSARAGLNVLTENAVDPFFAIGSGFKYMFGVGIVLLPVFVLASLPGYGQMFFLQGGTTIQDAAMTDGLSMQFYAGAQLIGSAVTLALIWVLAIFFVLTPTVLLYEGGGFGKLARSFRLTAGYRLPIALFLFLVYAAWFLIVALSIGVMFGLFSSTFATPSLGGVGVGTILMPMVVFVHLLFIVSAIGTGLMSLVGPIIYQRLLRLKEDQELNSFSSNSNDF